MGQQQLLLLVLATVIVGLATVAGIEAFDENQAQASQDALVRRATDIAADIKAAESKPAQLGGVTLGTTQDSDGNDVPVSTPSEIATIIGLSDVTVPVQGAGNGATCTVGVAGSGSQATVTCSGGDAPQGVTVTFDPNTNPEISTSFND